MATVPGNGHQGLVEVKVFRYRGGKTCYHCASLRLLQQLPWMCNASSSITTARRDAIASGSSRPRQLHHADSGVVLGEANLKCRVKRSGASRADGAGAGAQSSPETVGAYRAGQPAVMAATYLIGQSSQVGHIGRAAAPVEGSGSTGCPMG
jgi:hypothetical protein